MTAAILRASGRVHSCREPECGYTTRWALDLWEHRLRSGHMDAAR